ncbi:MAG: Ni/Fe hydrogenase subunit alpha [Fimbriimonadales bacterium]
MKTISIDPITRLEGHGKIEIFLDDNGEVANAYVQIPELRGFEKFCEGRAVEEVAHITPRICGVCPEAHHMAGMKTLDAVFKVEPTSTAKKLRRLLYNSFFVSDHTTHFYILAGPDFVVGPDAPVAERNILGVIAKVGLETGGEVIKRRRECNHIVEMLAGRQVHPICGLPGGVSKGLNAEEIAEAKQIAANSLEFAKFSIQLFHDMVLGNTAYKDLILSDMYAHKTYYMGLVDDQNRADFYDGKVRVVDPDGNEFAKFPASEYLEHIAEHVEPWSYLKFPYLKKIGWKGFVEGKDSGIYRTAPLARINASDAMATPLANAELQRFRETLGRTVHATLATHWARLIELMQAAEAMVELTNDPEIGSDDLRNRDLGTPGEGVGIVEAPRGTLIHHYISDENGIAQKVNLIVGTTHNNAPICMSIKRAAQGLIHKNGEISEGTLNKVEMAFRAYDPCFGCATHAIGQTPLIVTVYAPDGSVVAQGRRDPQ